MTESTEPTFQDEPLVDAPLSQAPAESGADHLEAADPAGSAADLEDGDEADDRADEDADEEIADEEEDGEDEDGEDGEDQDAEDEDGEDVEEAHAGASAKGRSAKLVALDEEGDIAADYLEELLDIADLDGDIDTFTEGGRAHVSIVTDANLLVGRDGEVLEALQELSRLAVMTETGKRSRLMLDIAGHREKRRVELTDLATDAVEEAKASGESVRLTPMNPFERKIVHDVVAAAGLNSESDGEEPNRRVVVMPA